ncbi:C6 finger domain-containing protein [Blastomyces gilchristii SLH14081]|uniref:C6 finger domain-containing protein n=1 Tax=Blastomyces gilchristii (strain SLH14081) TaxID=559298 RepID=A0A179UZV5_BLAGS|nr:C6 finger domain-containing protein [Blastomyces gilchristii SLH14081]OAT13380.1 C6 finger domain-containing protein [Blastomyces gilchristii SLH14081]
METGQSPHAISSTGAVQPKGCIRTQGSQSPPVVSSRVAPASQPGKQSAGKPPSHAAGGVNKPKQSKSRNGCVTCKTKRLKCDETKPTCQQCHKRNVTCGGYKKDFKWRPFKETRFTNKSAPKGKKVPLSAPPPSPTVPARKPIRLTLSPLTPHSSNSPEEDTVEEYQSPYLSLEGVTSFPAYDIYPHYLFPSLLSLQDHYLDDYCAEIIPDSSYISLTQSPKLAESLLANDTTGQLECPSEWLASAPPPTPDLIDLEDEDVEEIVRQSNPEVSLPSCWDASSASVDCFKNLLKRSISYGPSLHPESPAMLLSRYDRQTCGILSVKDGISENPWRTLVWPLAADCPALFHAICCLSAFHCVKENPRLRVHGMDHMHQSMSMLATGIETMKMDEALTTTLALVFAESWDRHISTGMQHRRGARVLLNQALAQHRQRTNPPAKDIARLHFLYNTWLYTDVVARLISLEDGEVDEALLLQDLNPYLPRSPIHEVDPLMGCATTLFPLISRVASLVQKVRKSKSNSIPLISQALELKTLIEEWEVPKYFQPPEDPTSNVQHSFQTAQAYRWAILLYLHQAVPEVPSESGAELAKRVLVLLATVPPSSRATIVHIYPLFAASCEVESEEDRNWVKERWAAMQSRLMIGNIDRCLEVVREVWRRRDSFNERNKNSPQASFAQPVDTTQRKSIYGVSKPPTVDNDENMEESSAIFELSDGSKSNPAIAGKGKKIKTYRSLSSPVSPIRRGSFIPWLDDRDIESTVRGRLHWVGVMRDWGWEVLLG